MAPKAVKQRHNFPYAFMRKLALRVLNGELYTQKGEVKQEILTQYDTNEGVVAYEAVKQVAYETGMGRGLSRTIKCTQEYLDRLTPDVDEATVSKMYKSLNHDEPETSLSERVSALRILLSNRQAKALNDKAVALSVKSKYDELFGEYSKQRSVVVKSWKLKYSELVKKLRESRDANPRLHELRAAKKLSSDAEEKKRLSQEIKSVIRTLNDEFSSSLVSVDVITRTLGITAEEAQRLVPVFALRKKISDINDNSVRVSHADHLLSCIAEREVIELASCTRVAFSARVASGGVARPTLEDLVNGMGKSTDAVSAFFKSSPTCRKLLLGEEVAFCDDSKALKSFVINTSKPVLNGLTSDVVLAMCGVVYESLVALLRLFKSETKAKTVSRLTVSGVIRTVLTSHGFDSAAFDSVIEEAFTVKRASHA